MSCTIANSTSAGWCEANGERFDLGDLDAVAAAKEAARAGDVNQLRLLLAKTHGFRRRRMDINTRVGSGGVLEEE